MTGPSSPPDGPSAACAACQHTWTCSPTISARRPSAGSRPPSLPRKVTAVGYEHHRAGSGPLHRSVGGVVVLDSLAGKQRARATPAQKKTAAEAYLVVEVLRIQGDQLAGLRDRAILSFGMASAQRRSEPMALDVADLAPEARGLRATIAVPRGGRLKPVEVLQRWLERVGTKDGPLSRSLPTNGRRVLDAQFSDRGVTRIVQARVRRPLAAVGLPDVGGGKRREHLKTREVSRHKPMQVPSDYVQSAELLDDHAGRGSCKGSFRLSGQDVDGLRRDTCASHRVKEMSSMQHPCKRGSGRYLASGASSTRRVLDLQCWRPPLWRYQPCYPA